MKYTAYPQSIIPFERNSIKDIDKIIYKEHEDDAELKIVLDDDNILYSIDFEWIYMFRVADEGILLNMLATELFLDGKDDGRGIFIVEGSRYVQSFHDESYNIYIDDAIHYQISTDNDVVDIIANRKVQPVINRLDINS